MKSSRILILLLIMCVLAGVNLWRYQRAQADAEASTSFYTPAPGGNASWRFKNEQHWVVDQIGRDITEIVSFIHDPNAQLSTDDAAEFSVNVASAAKSYDLSAKNAAGKVERKVTVEHHLWAPENYTPWVQALMDGWKVAPGAGKADVPEDTGMPARLTKAGEVEWIKECQRITALLADHPLDAEVHEQAALALGWFGLQEAAGCFSDARPALSRMSAHLAIAHALRPEPKTCGKLAAAIQLSLVGLEAEALESIKTLPAEQGVWHTALEIRNTNNWKKLHRPQDTTPLEQSEYMRALVECSVSPPMEKLMADDPKKVLPVEWGRVVMEQSFSVQEGHMFARESIFRELQELGRAWHEWSGKLLTQDTWVGPANELPTLCLAKVPGTSGRRQLEVISWGDLGAFHQRHILHAAQHCYDFIENMWGVPEEAAKVEGMIQKTLSGLRLYPAMNKRAGRNQTTLFGTAMQAEDMCEKHPEWVSAANWAAIISSSTSPQHALVVNHLNAWFEPTLPEGTLYDVAERMYKLPRLHDGPHDLWAARAKMAPYRYTVLYVKNYFANVHTPDQLEQSYAMIKEYHLDAVRELYEACRGHEQEKCIAYMQKASEMNPDTYVKLGDYLVEKHKPDDAAAAYQSAFELAHDRVLWANKSQWLVDYCFDHGRKNDALKIATEAGEVYSFSGLACQGHLMERMERWKDAELAYRNIAERYENGGPLRGFYIRCHAKDSSFQSAYETVKQTIFPKGMKMVTLADFSESPRHGVTFSSSSDHLVQAGLKRGDVVVALNGYEVRNVDQYNVIHDASTDPHLKLIVWNGKSYTEVSAEPPGRLFGVKLDNYAPKK